MEIKKTEIEGLVIIEPKVFGDNRGWFTETYSKKLLDEAHLAVLFLYRTIIQCRLKKVRCAVCIISVRRWPRPSWCAAQRRHYRRGSRCAPLIADLYEMGSGRAYSIKFPPAFLA